VYPTQAGGLAGGLIFRKEIKILKKNKKKTATGVAIFFMVLNRKSAIFFGLTSTV